MPNMRRFALAAATALLPIGAGAQVDAKLTGLGQSLVAYGVYVGPYQGTVGTMAGVQDLTCVDFFHHAYVGMEWTAHITVLADGADLSRTRFGQLTNAMDRYRQAAWLKSKFDDVGVYGNAFQTGEVHAAIWDLFRPETPDAPGPGPIGAAWKANAIANFMDGSVNYNTVAVLSDINIDQSQTPGAGGAQEYLFVTPEPTSMALVGFGVVGLAAFARRRRRSA